MNKKSWRQEMLSPDLIKLLLWFREFPATVQADIRKAFLMISVREQDRMYLHFFWPNGEGMIQPWWLSKLSFGLRKWREIVFPLTKW